MNLSLLTSQVMNRESDLIESYKVAFSELTMGKELGEGSFGTVFQAMYHGQAVAVK